MTAIETNGLTKEFGDVVAVDDVSLRIEDGEVFGFLGPNGAGKSTTINMLLDFVRPSDGSASVLEMDAQNRSERIRRRVGVLPEGFDLYDRLSGRKHVEFAMQTKDVDGDPDEYLERVGLDGDAGDRNVGGYSKGMQQRLALGMALVGDPELLIMDEPSSGLDPTGINEMQEIVREEAERGTTVFFSSHILEHVEAVCDRIGIMSEGELVAVGTLEELLEDVGGQDRMELTLDEVPEGVLDTLQDVDAVTGAQRRGGTVEITCAEPTAKAKAINHVEDVGATVLDIQVDDDSIDTVFAELTGNGESTADGDAEAAEQEVMA